MMMKRKQYATIHLAMLFVVWVPRSYVLLVQYSQYRRYNIIHSVKETEGFLSRQYTFQISIVPVVIVIRSL